MNTDTLQTMTDNLVLNNTTQTSSINWWMIVSIVELFLIVLLLVHSKERKKDAKTEAKKKVLSEGNIDFGNTIMSTFHSKELYKQLIEMCHPDRFAPDAQKMKQANDISSRITENKNNFKQLVSLKEEAESCLGIKIK